MNGCNGSRRTYNDASIAVYPLDDIQHSDSRFTIFVLPRCCQNPQWHILWQLVRQLGSIRLTMTMTTTTTGTTSTTHVSTDDWHLFPPFLELPQSTIATGELLIGNNDDMVASYLSLAGATMTNDLKLTHLHAILSTFSLLPSTTNPNHPCSLATSCCPES